MYMYSVHIHVHVHMYINMYKTCILLYIHVQWYATMHIHVHTYMYNGMQLCIYAIRNTYSIYA